METIVKENNDHLKAEELNLTQHDRWSMGLEHHPKSIRVMEFLAAHDFHDYQDYFDWNTGGDGDNGETLMYQLDALFEMLDIYEDHL